MTEGTIAPYLASAATRESLKKLTAVIPIGGAGGQMSPLTAGQPKSLLPLGGLPILTHIINGLDPEVFDKVIIAYNWFEDQVQNYVSAAKNQVNISVEAFWTDRTPPQMLLELRGQLSDPFLIHYGDIILERNLDWQSIHDEFMNAQSKDSSLFMGLLLGSTHYEYEIGVIQIDRSGQRTRIVDFTEKPGEMPGDRFANVAVAVLSHAFLTHIQPSDYDLFGQSLVAGLKKGSIFNIASRSVEWLHLQRTSDWVDAQDAYYKIPSDSEPLRVKGVRDQLRGLGISPRPHRTRTD
jgi:NDP-sugar pyrophosphorylase family protein